jgi:outer membrane protein OmpA-like peptidoglycan-associated protein
MTSGTWAGTLSANYGILQSFRVAKRFSINLELAGSFFRNGFSSMPGWSGHDMMWTATAGFTVDLGRVGWDNAPDVEALQGIYAGMIDGLQGQLDDALAANREKQNQIKALEQANKALETDVANYKNVKPLSVSKSIFFEFASSKIASKKELLNIKAYAEAAKAAGVAVKVVGFADIVGTNEYNVKLSQSRAEAVAKVLREAGAGVVTVIGYGESEEYKERFLNRRVIITVAE